jgi:hypothetical protein
MDPPPNTPVQDQTAPPGPEKPVAAKNPPEQPQANDQGAQESPILEENGNVVLTADPGGDRSVFVGDIVTLDGRASRAAEGRVLSFTWSFIAKPAHSRSKLSDSTAVGPTFVADLAGVYLIELVVDDGIDESVPETVIVVAEPRPRTVPGLVGLDLKRAEARLTDEGLTIGPITTVYDQHTPKNQVLGQDPPAGTIIIEPLAVGLVICFPPDDDDDQDGLPDTWEYSRFGGLQQRGADDADGDGYSNQQEYLIGTDPMDRSEAPVPAGTFFEYDRFGRIVVKQITLEP